MLIELISLFKEIRVNKRYYTNSKDGDEFEKKFKKKLEVFGFSEIIQRSKTKSAIDEISELEKIEKKKSEEIFKKIKKEILLKNSKENINNRYKKIKKMFIFQPYGAQNFPDFIIFTNKFIIPIEIKYSKNDDGQKNIDTARPMWNSNLPKPNAIYIFGVSNKITTFFIGNDILDYDTRKVLLNYFENINKNEIKLNQKLKNLKNNFGIYPYIRKAYEHKKTKSTFSSNDDKTIESYFSKNSENREKNVIKFLNKLNEFEK